MYLLAESIWATLGAGVLAGILPLLATVLTVAVAALAKKGVDKLGIKRSQDIDDMIDKYVGIGVGYAERYAKSKLAADGTKVGGNDKLALAVKSVMGELDQSGIKGVAENLIVARIESALEGTEKKVTG